MQKVRAQSGGGDTENANLFKVLCYNAMPKIDKIKILAKQFKWIPITSQKKLQTAAPPGAEITSINGWLFKNKGEIYQLMLFRSSPGKRFAVLKNYKNAVQYRCIVTALKMSAPDKQAGAITKVIGSKPKLLKRASGGITYRWLARVSSKSLTMVRLITSPDKPNGVVLMDLLVNP